MEVFKPAERQIFKYEDGNGKVLCADPLVVIGKMRTLAIGHGKTIDEWIKLARPSLSGGPKADEMTDIELTDSWNAISVLEDISRHTFNLAPYDEATGGGADATYALAVLNRFNVWSEKKNQKQSQPSMQSQFSESTSAIQPTTAM